MIRFFCFFYLMLSASVEATNWMYAELNPDQCQFIALDDPRLSPIKLDTLLPQKQRQHTTGCYATDLKLAQNIRAPALFIESVRFADQSFINGVLIGQKGSLSEPYDFFLNAPTNLPRFYRFDARLLNNGYAKLRIAINSAMGTAKFANFPGGNRVAKVKLGDAFDLSPDYHKALSHVMVVDTLIITASVAIIFALGLFYALFKTAFLEYRWLVATVVLLCFSSFCLDASYTVIPAGFPSSWLLLSGMIFSPVLHYFHFLSTHTPRGQFEQQLLLSSSVLTWLILIMPNWPDIIKDAAWYCWLPVPIYCLCRGLYAHLRAVQRRTPGARVMLAGLILYVVAIEFRYFPSFLSSSYSVHIGAFIFSSSIIYLLFAEALTQRRLAEARARASAFASEALHQSISREIHDEISQALAAAKLFLKLYLRQPQALILGKLNTQLDEAIGNSRKLIDSLRSEELEQQSLSQACVLEGEKFQDQIRLHIKGDDLSSLCPMSKQQVFRIFQETLRNTIKHSGASDFWLNIKCQGPIVEVSFADNGTWYDRDPNQPRENGGQGLRGLHERAQILGGSLKRNTGSKGTQWLLCFVSQHAISPVANKANHAEV